MDRWKKSTLGKSCEFYNGKAHEKCVDPNGKYIIVNSKFISSNGNTVKRTSNDLFPLLKGDIVLVMSDVPNGKALAKCTLIDEDERYTLNQRICCIRSEQFEKKFLYYHLNRHPYLLSFNNGENQTNLRKGDILNCPLFIPPFPEQKRIVSILDEAFEGIDKLIANTEKNLENAWELFESCLIDLLTPKGEEWKEKTLQEVSIEFGRGKSKHRPRNDPSLYGGQYPFIQTGDVRNSDHLITQYSQTYNEAGLSQSKLWPKGTICITIAANIAETGILDFDACFPDSIIGIVVDEEQTSSSYVEFLLQSVKARIQAKGKGSAQDNINLGTFKKEYFFFPSLAKQYRIVARLESISEQVQRLQSLYSGKLELLTELKQAILHKAFTGKLTSEKVDKQLEAV